jgi:hypothetical protein
VSLANKGMPSQCFSSILEAPWNLHCQVASTSILSCHVNVYTAMIFLGVDEDVLTILAVEYTQASRGDS